jgi:hypothetical protein
MIDMFTFVRRLDNMRATSQLRCNAVKELQKDAVYEIPVLLPTKYNITIRM